MNINDLSLNELKALAYDHLAQLENVQVNLKVINDEIRVKINTKKMDEIQGVETIVPTVSEEVVNEPAPEVPAEQA